MGVWLGGGVEKKSGGFRCFFPGPTKKFSLQNGEKTRGRSSLSWAAQKAPVHSSLLTFFSSLLLIYAHSSCFGFFVLSHLFFFFFLLFLLLSSIVLFSLFFYFFVTNLQTFTLFCAFFFHLTFSFFFLLFLSLSSIVPFFFCFHQFLDLACLRNNNNKKIEMSIHNFLNK